MSCSAQNQISSLSIASSDIWVHVSLSNPLTPPQLALTFLLVRCTDSEQFRIPKTDYLLTEGEESISKDFQVCRPQNTGLSSYHLNFKWCSVLSSVELTSILVPSYRLKVTALFSSCCRATVENAESAKFKAFSFSVIKRYSIVPVLFFCVFHYTMSMRHTRHCDTSWNTIRHHETSRDIMRHYETSWNTITFWATIRHYETQSHFEPL